MFLSEIFISFSLQRTFIAYWKWIKSLEHWFFISVRVAKENEYEKSCPLGQWIVWFQANFQNEIADLIWRR